MCRRCSFFDHVYFSVGSFCDVSDKRKKKAFFRSVTDAWPFSPTSSAWSGALFCSWRESLTSICTFSCLRNSGCLRCQGKTALCLAQSSKLAGLKKKKRLKDTPSVWTQEICVRLEVTPSLLPACGPRVVTAKSWRIMVRNVFSVLRFVSAKEKRDRMRHGAVDSCLIGP